MKHTFSKSTIKRIILEELENSNIEDAAAEIVDELESFLQEGNEERKGLLPPQYLKKIPLDTKGIRRGARGIEQEKRAMGDRRVLRRSARLN